MKHFIRIRHTARPLLGWLCGLAALNAIRRTRTSTYSGPMWMRLPNWHCWKLSDVSVSGIPHGTVSVSGPWRLGEGWEKEPHGPLAPGRSGRDGPCAASSRPFGTRGRGSPLALWCLGGGGPARRALGPRPLGAWEREAPRALWRLGEGGRNPTCNPSEIKRLHVFFF